MASYHCTVKVGSRGMGGKHADYIQRTGTYKNYRDGEELAHTESVNIPSWAEHDPSEFFRQADLHERANGSAYREIEVAIPRELTPEQRIEFIREFVKQEIGEDHPCVWAIHQPKSALTETEQPHAHIMFSERKLDGIERNPEQFFKRAAAPYRHRVTKEMVPADPTKGGCAKSDKFAGSPTERKEKLVALRERFASLQNAHLARHGHTDRVTHKSLEAQGIDRLPEKHLGPVGARVEENIAAILRNRDANQKLAAADYEVSQIDLSSAIKEQQNALSNRNQHARQIPPPHLRNRMLDLSSRDLVLNSGRDELPLRENVPGRVDRPEEKQNPDVQRPGGRIEQRAVADALAQAIADAKAQAVAAEAAKTERKAAWLERGQRRRSGAPNRVIRLDKASTQDGRTLYRWGGNGPSAGKVAVIEKGNQLSASGKCSAPKAAAMAQIAQQNGWQSVTLTGDDAFKALALPQFLSRGIAVSNPELQPQVQAYEAKAQAEQQAAAEARARILEADRLAMKKYWSDRVERDAARQVDAKAQPSAAAQREQPPPQVAKPAPDPYLGMNNTQRILAERAAERTKQREAAAAPVQSKPSAPSAPKVGAVDLMDGLQPSTQEDSALVQRIAEAIKAGNPRELKACRDRLMSAKREVAQALVVVEPQAVNPAAIEHQVKTEQNEAARRAGQPAPWGFGARTSVCGWDRIAEDAAKERDEHLKTPRPKGFFGGDTAGTRAWTSKAETLSGNAQSWLSVTARLKKELGINIEQRVENETRSSAAQNRQNAPERERQLGRQEFTKELEKRLDKALEPIVERERQIEREKDNDNDMDYGI